MKKQKKNVSQNILHYQNISISPIILLKNLNKLNNFLNKSYCLFEKFYFSFFSGKYAQIFILKMPGKYLPKIVFVI